ncbi:uncharacterized protein LOC111388910 [Olea europaea var. sylvestris]|uniref:uncharacterized protein LOC111388910 n=1 Tax=Olea europaea var. sylvestris TaxID=158386 RepID=UPI000C1CF3D7|nr:uncharacterized protein LOC111388910 [Olea europaea var. sylvestris]
MSSSRLIKLILDDSDSNDDLETAIAFVDGELLNKRRWILRQGSIQETHDPYFVQRRNATRTLSLSSLQKITASLRMLSYGVAADFIDEYIRIGESTAIESLKRFVKSKWKNCPEAWKGMCIGHVREPTIILEVITFHDLWIWHAFIGLPGSHNDINVLDISFLIKDLVKRHALPANY